jgi:hypothetical protein
MVGKRRRTFVYVERSRSECNEAYEPFGPVC